MVNPDSTPFSRTYSYDAIGNITNKSDQGNYTYSETNYANPNAVTDVNGTTYTYDNVGNITDIGSTDYTWDYRNRLIQTDIGAASTFYEYDYNNTRTAKGDGTATTTYVNPYYNLSTAGTTTKHILGPNGETIATIEGNGTATSTHFVHNDHLGGTNVVTDDTGALTQTLDYYPFGETRIDTKAASFDEQLKFTGHEYDGDSDLTYAKARYLDQDIGKFLSKDAWEGDLYDPQSFNKYAYARNNPINLYDPTGNYFVFGNFRATMDILNHNTAIYNAANSQPNVSHTVLAAILYNERAGAMNYNLFDKLADRLGAALGRNTSLGFGQINIETALSVVEAGYVDISDFKGDTPRQQVINALLDTNTNINIAAGVLQQHIDQWKEAYPDIANDAAIMGTLYNIGERPARDNPQANSYGEASADAVSKVESLVYPSSD